MSSDLPTEVNTTTSSTLEAGVTRARALADQLATGPCADVEAGETRCIDRENNVARQKGEGFPTFRSDRMCEACASFLHAEMAAFNAMIGPPSWPPTYSPGPANPSMTRIPFIAVARIGIQAASLTRDRQDGRGEDSRSTAHVSSPSP